MLTLERGGMLTKNYQQKIFKLQYSKKNSSRNIDVDMLAHQNSQKSGSLSNQNQDLMMGETAYLKPMLSGKKVNSPNSGR